MLSENSTQSRAKFHIDKRRMARYLAQIIILGAQLVGRALVKTMRQELQAFEDAARIQESLRANEPSSGRSVLAKDMTLAEAQQILNVSDLSDRQAIDSHYQHLFGANEKANGGTFYIQSKVFRAKERIDQELERLLKSGVSQSSPASPAAATAASQCQDKETADKSR
ncbi:mitochondrial import inner membrane translocase subunit tim16-B [Drosophila teissieri]|uniref:mitochondrial import inner membrane translocase subunit tim16-B n=1 Tax=Drosophila teissieri TaxID=7243 RepID=UPI001CBA424D|nr:mitochondrial import inner membrane translocase subunit tim16-B [Drosophila teissieri]